eukprot:jgi/Hompol1/911/HPOL_001604-RA
MTLSNPPRANTLPPGPVNAGPPTDVAACARSAARPATASAAMPAPTRIAVAMFLFLPIDPFATEYIATLKQFSAYLNREARKASRHGSAQQPPLTSESIQSQYEAYCTSHAKKLHEKFFNENKDNEWFRERYHPVESLELANTIKSRRAELREQFIERLTSGQLANLNFDQHASETAASADAESQNLSKPAPFSEAAAATASSEAAAETDSMKVDTEGATSDATMTAAAKADRDTSEQEPSQKSDKPASHSHSHALQLSGIASTIKRSELSEVTWTYAT